MKQLYKIQILIVMGLFTVSLFGCAVSNGKNFSKVQLSNENNGCLLKIKFSEKAHFDGPWWLLFLRQTNNYSVELRFPAKQLEVAGKDVDYRISSGGKFYDHKIYSGTLHFEKQIVDIALYYDYYNDLSRLRAIPVNGVHSYRGSCS